MPRHERRLTKPTPTNFRSAIPRNYRIVRNWTQVIAANEYGVSERTWRRYEERGAPAHVLKRIKQYSDRAGSEYAAYLS